MAIIGTEMGKRKGKAIRRGIQERITGLEGMSLAPETTRAYEQSQMMANLGIPESTKALFKQQSDKAMLMGLRSLQGQGRGAALAGVGGIVKSGQDAALRMAEADERARAANRQMAMQMGAQYGQQKLGLEKYKGESLFNYLTGRRAQRMQTVNQAMQAVSNIAGLAIPNIGGK